MVIEVIRVHLECVNNIESIHMWMRGCLVWCCSSYCAITIFLWVGVCVSWGTKQINYCQAFSLFFNFGCEGCNVWKSSFRTHGCLILSIATSCIVCWFGSGHGLCPLNGFLNKTFVWLLKKYIFIFFTILQKYTFSL